MRKMRITRLMAIVLTVVMMLGLWPQLSVSAAYENTHVNTGNQAYDIVEVAKTQIGYVEGSNNDTKYNRWYGTLSGLGYNYAWCQTFVAWCADQADIPTSLIARVSGTISAKDAFKKNGTYHTGPYEGGSYTPKKGDIIFFYSSATESKHHVGIVSDCVNGTVYTIEGNSSDMVVERSYSVTNSKIRGYGCPNYSGGTVETEPPSWATLATENYIVNYNVGDPVVFYADSDIATEYYINIDKDSKRLICEPMTEKRFSISFTETGYYTACVTARNSAGWVDSEYIGFRILQPANLGNNKIIYIENTSNNFLFTVQENNVLGAEKNYNKNQLWKLKLQDDGSYRFANLYDDQCLEVFSAGITNGTNVSVYTETAEFINQKFYIYDLYGAYYIKPVCSDLFVDMSLNIPYNVATYGYADDWAPQKFNIVDVTNALPLIGNINQDTSITLLDAVLLQKHLLSLRFLTAEQMQLADINGDGVVNVFDMSLLKTLL